MYIVGFAERVLRQNPQHKYLRSTATAKAAASSMALCWIESPWVFGALPAAHQRGVSPHVWTWNAIAKATVRAAWPAPRIAQGFLLNHLITEEIPLGGSPGRGSATPTRSRPAGWYDVRCAHPAGRAEEADETSPQSAVRDLACARRRVAKATLWRRS